MDDYSLGVLEACFYFQEAIEELVKDEEAKKALQERIRRKSAKTLPLGYSHHSGELSIIPRDLAQLSDKASGNSPTNPSIT